MQEANSNNIEEILNSPTRVALDFFGDWCGPCKMMLPIYDKIDSEDESITFYKVDVDLSKEIAQSFSIKGIPTVIIIENGKEIARIVGAQTEENIKNKLSELQ